MITDRDYKHTWERVLMLLSFAVTPGLIDSANNTQDWRLDIYLSFLYVSQSRENRRERKRERERESNKRKVKLFK